MALGACRWATAYPDTTTKLFKMKSFVISAIIGAAALGIQGVNAIQVANAAAIPNAGKSTVDVKLSLAETLAKAKRDSQETCWEAPDGQVQCWKHKSKRATGETCWETDDGQVECWKVKEKRGTDETCWETDDGQVECWKEKGKRGTDETCWETPDGQVECWKVKGKRDGPKDTCVGGHDQLEPWCTEDKAKRGTDETCWEAPDGQVQCWKVKEKRGTDETCWETDDGQVECWKEKRDASAEPALVAGQNVTFAQFRKLNPSVNSNCTNLSIGHAYCTRGMHDGLLPDNTSPPGTSGNATHAASSILSSLDSDLAPEVPMTNSTILTITPNITLPKPAESKPYYPAVLVTKGRTGPGIFGLPPFVAAHALTSGTKTTAATAILSISPAASASNTLPLPAPSSALPTLPANTDFSWSGPLSYTTLFPSLDSAAAASQSSSEVAKYSDISLPSSSSGAVYSSSLSFASSTASSLPSTQPPHISQTSADYAHVSVPQLPKISHTSSAEYAHVSLSQLPDNSHTSSAEYGHVSLPQSTTFAIVTTTG
ncbi:MAG: hypothetical protein Q9218_002711 [Villophora microphyllina]